MQSKPNANTGIALSGPLKVSKCYRKVFLGYLGLGGYTGPEVAGKRAKKCHWLLSWRRAVEKAL